MARQFTDAKDRQWVIHLDVNVLRRVKKELNVDLADIEVFGAIAGNPILLAEVLGVVLGPQLAKLDLSPDDLAAAFYGDVIDAATEGLMHAIIDFFPKRQRELSRLALAKGKVVEERFAAAVEATIDRKLAEFEAEMMKQLNGPANLSILGESSPSAPESAA